MTAQHLFVGCYTGSMNGNGTGITVLAVDESGVLLSEVTSVPIDSPSFLDVSENKLFAVSEGAEGRLTSFIRRGARLAPVSNVSTGGAEPCHVVHDAPGRRILVANYASGSLAIVPVNADASLDDARITAPPSGSGPVDGRQDSPHIHQAIASEPDTNRWLVTDLGADRALEYSISAAHGVSPVGSFPVPRGTGPRHMAWAHGALLIAGELDSRLHVLRRKGAGMPGGASLDAHAASGHGGRLEQGGPSKHGRALEHDGRLEHDSPVEHDGSLEHDGRLQHDSALEHDGSLELDGSVSTIDPSLICDTPNYPSHLDVTSDERFAYVANRGRNTMSVFSLAAVARGGLPELVQETPCGGDWPRHFALHAGNIYVANQRSGDIAVFQTDPASGRIGDRVQSVPTGSPTCLVFANSPVE